MRDWRVILAAISVAIVAAGGLLFAYEYLFL